MESIGECKSKIAAKLLLELNPDVSGDYVEENISNLLENNPEMLKKFNIIVAACVTEMEIRQLSLLLWEWNIPLIYCQSYGFYGAIRLQVKEHDVVQAHPDNENPDLRVDKPFAELKSYTDSVNLDDMDFKDHAHVPYVVILRKYLEEFIRKYGSTPKTYEDKMKLKQLISGGIRKDENGVKMGEENFEEALKAVNYALNETNVPKEINRLFEDDACNYLTKESKPFWIMVRALKEFVQMDENRCLPVRGTLPDMTAETKKYVDLQRIYRKKAEEDAKIVFELVQRLLHQLRLPFDISAADVKLFCKHSGELHVQRGTKIIDEYDNKMNRSHYIDVCLEEEDSKMEFYIMLRAVEKYRSEYKVYPGILDETVETDILKLKTFVVKTLSELGCRSTCPIKDDMIHEFCTYGGCELHSVSSFLGGCVAQEVIKLVTRQYKPVNNVVVYDANLCQTATFTL